MGDVDYLLCKECPAMQTREYDRIDGGRVKVERKCGIDDEATDPDDGCVFDLLLLKLVYEARLARGERVE